MWMQGKCEAVGGVCSIDSMYMLTPVGTLMRPAHASAVNLLEAVPVDDAKISKRIKDVYSFRAVKTIADAS